MKVHVIENTDQVIDGYTPAIIRNGKIELKCSNHSVDEILCLGIVDKIHARDIDSFLKSLCDILRINGKLVISGKDINIISRHLYFKEINSESLSNIIDDTKTWYSSLEIVDKLRNLGLTILTNEIKGIEYEICSIRKIS